MGIWKKQKMSKNDILAAINALSDEEQTELLEELASALEEQEDASNDTAEPKEQTQDDARANGKPDTEEQIDKAEEDIAEKGADSQTEKDRIDESVGEQEKEEGDEDSQDAKDRVDESLGEEEAKEDSKQVEQSEAERVEKEDAEEVNAAMAARVSALEESVATLTERIEQMLTNFENNDFGVHQGGGAEKPSTENDEAYMDAYYAKQTRRK